MPSLIDLDQYRHFRIASVLAFDNLRGVLTMSEITKSQAISRRRLLSLFGTIAAFGVAASTTALGVSDAEAQTAGMERRQERRAGRHERREERRVGRHERREERRTGTNTGAGTTTGTAK
jgi:hypothetical protein